MRIKNMILLMGMFTLVFINFVSAVPPALTNVNTLQGYELYYPQFTVVKQDTSFKLHVHASNISDGVPLVNTEADCYVHLYDIDGNHTFESSAMGLDGNGLEWDIFLDTGNFSTFGIHGYYIWCTSGEFGGEAKGIFLVNPLGIEFSVPLAIMFVAILFLLSTFLIITIKGIQKTDEGAWMIFYICMSYILLYLLVALFWIFTSNFVWILPMIGNIFYIAWFIMGIGFLPFAIIVSLVIMGQEAKAAMQKNLINQGYTRDEAKSLSRNRKR